MSLTLPNQSAVDLLAQIADEVAAVEGVLQSELHSQVSLVRQISRHTLDAGGKRLRPALVGLCGRLFNPDLDLERLRRLGACIEMIHMATLIHDDVIDGSDLRRGRPTAAKAFGNTGSILTGDVILAKAMAILAEDGDLRIIRTVSRAVVELAEGEVAELEVRGRLMLSEQEHLRILRMKTASLIACCCEVGALAANTPDFQRETVAAFGHHIGLAFQLIDDLLDYRGDAAVTGKPVAVDFHEGQATLPLIFLQPKLSDDEREIVQRGFGNGVTSDEIAWLVSTMEHRGVFAEVEARVEFHRREALRALANLPASPERDLLEAVAEFVIRRQK